MVYTICKKQIKGVEMGIKYRASMSKRDYKKLPVDDLTDQGNTAYVCDAVTIIPSKHHRYRHRLYENIDVVLHRIDGNPIKLRIDRDGISIGSCVMLDIESKTKYTGLFPKFDERLMVYWNGCELKINAYAVENVTKTV